MRCRKRQRLLSSCHRPALASNVAWFGKTSKRCWAGAGQILGGSVFALTRQYRGLKDKSSLAALCLRLAHKMTLLLQEWHKALCFHRSRLVGCATASGKATPHLSASFAKASGKIQAFISHEKNQWHCHVRRSQSSDKIAFLGVREKKGFFPGETGSGR